MLTKKTEDLYKLAAEVNGVESQTDMVTEECAELIQAINKYKRKGTNETIHHLAEEVADVKIMIEQLEYNLKFSYLVDQFKIIKLERLENRLNKKLLKAV